MARREKRKARRPRKPSIIEADVEAREADSRGETKKRFSVKDLKFIKPKTPAQEDIFHLAAEDKSIALVGSAGTGKTFLSMYLSLRDVLDIDTPYEKIIIVRSAVQTREMGHMPGTLDEKAAHWELPYKAICDELFPWTNSYDNLKKAGKVEFLTTSFIRGVTLTNCIVIFDEAQNTDFSECASVITRLGENSKIYLIGDTNQNDLTKRKTDKSGFIDILKIIQRMSYFGIVNFTTQDCVRSGLVREFLITKEEMGFDYT